MANVSITLSGIHQTIENLNYRPGTVKYKAVQAIRSFYPSEDALNELTAIDADALIRRIWDTGDNPAKIRSKRRNFTSLRSSINSDLNKLVKKELNPENIIITETNIFDMTEEAKTSLLHSFTDAVKTGDIDLAKATDILKAVTDFLDEIDITATQDQSLDIIEEIKKVLSRLGGHILEGDAEEDIEEVEIDEDEDIEEVELDEDEEIEEIDDEPIDEDLDIEEIELDEDEDIEEIELDEDEEIEEVELDEDEELEEVDEDLLDEDDIEEVELDEDEDIEEIELDEDEELEEIDDELMDEDQDLEEIELDEDEELEEVDEDLLDEDDIEEVELDEDEDIEEIELDDDEELEEIDDELMDEDQDLEEIELDEDEELEEADEDLLDENDIEEVELDEDEDIEEIELDEDEELDEIEELDIDEDEEVEEIQLDENEELEEVDELDEEELDALEEFRKARELAEHFDDSLGDREKKFNAYVKIPQGIYTVGTRKSLKTSLELQQFEMPLVYIGKFPVTNALFEIFIEQTGYLTTAEKKGYGVVYHARYQKKGNRSSWRKQAGFRDVKGACWYQPDGPGSSLHDKRNHPVVQVSVEDALAYASWIGRRLPTEAEWEAAARTDLGFKYPWGSTFNPKALNIEQTGFSATCAVDTFEAHANEFGMSDILGNVMEWTTDRQYPPVNTKGNQKYNVAKGGAWNATESVTISSRGLFKQDFTANTIGFRCISELFQ